MGEERPGNSIRSIGRRVGSAALVAAMLAWNVDIGLTSPSHPGTASVPWRIVAVALIVLASVGSPMIRRTAGHRIDAWTEARPYRVALVLGPLVFPFGTLWSVALGDTLLGAVGQSLTIAVAVSAVLAFRTRTRLRLERLDADVAAANARVARHG